MTTKSKRDDDAKVRRFLAKAQAKQDREYNAQVARIKKAVAGAKFYAWELTEIERLVFAAFGRTKLNG